MASLKNAADKPVGLVGLGAMGRGVAGNLVRKGFPLMGYDGFYTNIGSHSHDLIGDAQDLLPKNF